MASIAAVSVTSITGPVSVGFIGIPSGCKCDFQTSKWYINKRYKQIVKFILFSSNKGEQYTPAEGNGQSQSAPFGATTKEGFDIGATAIFSE